jgi:uncharacterized membrane protein YccF (DUF307 family)
VKNKTINLFLYFSFIFVVFEIVSLVVYFILFGEFFSFSKISSAQNKIFSISSEEYALAQFGNKMMTIHPYQGFVYNKDEKYSTDGVPVSDMVFLIFKPNLRKKKKIGL